MGKAQPSVLFQLLPAHHIENLVFLLSITKQSFTVFWQHLRQHPFSTEHCFDSTRLSLHYKVLMICTEGASVKDCFHSQCPQDGDISTFFMLTEWAMYMHALKYMCMSAFLVSTWLVSIPACHLLKYYIIHEGIVQSWQSEQTAGQKHHWPVAI